MKGKHFYELIRRNKSGDRSGDELCRIDRGRHGTGLANAAVEIRFSSWTTRIGEVRRMKEELRSLFGSLQNCDENGDQLVAFVSNS